MDGKELDSVATILNDAYLATWAFSLSFHDDYDRPPTVAARVHYMRSVAQVGFERHERYELGREYVEFGRVEFTDTATDRTYLLRSNRAVSIEASFAQRTLFDATKYIASGTIMVVYRFGKDGIELSIAGTRRRDGSKHLEASGQPDALGVWPYTASEGTQPFDQGALGDPFGDLGELDIDDEEEGGGE